MKHRNGFSENWMYLVTINAIKFYVAVVTLALVLYFKDQYFIFIA